MSVLELEMALEMVPGPEEVPVALEGQWPEAAASRGRWVPSRSCTQLAQHQTELIVPV